MGILVDENNNNYIKDINPYERFNEINDDILSFYLKCNQLKNIYRQGWLKVRVGEEFYEKCESNADHIFSVALLALTIIEKNKLNLDICKCLKMSVIHDIGEVYTGDFTPFDGISKEQKHIKEKESIKKVLESIDNETDFYELWEEYDKAETPEAKFIKSVDKLEFVLQACAYGFDVQYFKRNIDRISDNNCKKIAEEALKLSNGNKKPKVVD